MRTVTVAAACEHNRFSDLQVEGMSVLPDKGSKVEMFICRECNSLYAHFECLECEKRWNGPASGVGRRLHSDLHWKECEYFEERD